MGYLGSTTHVIINRLEVMFYRVTNKMKSNDDFSLDKENIVGKTVRKERKCFAAGCISALCLLFTIPAPFLST